MDAIVKESTLQKVSDLVEVESDAIFSKIAPNPITYPLWCNFREQQNKKQAFYMDNVRNFDSVLEESTDS